MSPLTKKLIYFSILASIFLVRPLAAATFTVTTRVDTNDRIPGDGVCSDARQKCSLRAAVEESNALAGTDQIQLPANIYPLTILGSGEDLALTGDLDVTEDLSIVGAGPAITVIDAGVLSDRVFHILGSHTVVFRGVTIANGGYSSLKFGGGIYNDGGAVTVVDGILDANTAANGGGVFSDSASQLRIVDSILRANSGCGAGAFMNDGTLTVIRSLFENQSTTCSGGGITNADIAIVRDSTFDGNASGDGGAIKNTGQLNILRSTFTNNSSTDYGGAIRNDSPGTLVVRQSTFSGNSAGYHGGAVWSDGTATIMESTLSLNQAVSGDGGAIDNAGGTFDITNSTLSGNTASGATEYGGGLFNYYGRVTISSSTIYNNTSGYRGGGIYSNQTNTGGTGATTVTLRNTILAGNSSVTGNDCSENGSSSNSPYVSDGYNLIGDIADCDFTVDSTDQAGDSSGSGVIDPLLDALTNNGGLTETHALQASSPALDAGNPSGCTNGSLTLLYDQRGPGYDREKDGDGDGTAVCDIGAYEY